MYLYNMPHNFSCAKIVRIRMEMTSLRNNDKLDGKHQRDLIFVCTLFKINGLY